MLLYLFNSNEVHASIMMVVGGNDDRKLEKKKKSCRGTRKKSWIMAKLTVLCPSTRRTERGGMYLCHRQQSLCPTCPCKDLYCYCSVLLIRDKRLLSQSFSCERCGCFRYLKLRFQSIDWRQVCPMHN